MEPVTVSSNLLDPTLLKLLLTSGTPMSFVLRLVLALVNIYNATSTVPPTLIPLLLLKISSPNSRKPLPSSLPPGNGSSNFSTTSPLTISPLSISIKMVSPLSPLCVVTIGEVRTVTTSTRMSILVSRTSMVTKPSITTVMVSGVPIPLLVYPTNISYVTALNNMVSSLWVTLPVLTSKFLLLTWMLLFGINTLSMMFWPELLMNSIFPTRVVLPDTNLINLRWTVSTKSYWNWTDVTETITKTWVSTVPWVLIPWRTFRLSVEIKLPITLPS